MSPLDPISVVITTYNRSEALVAVLRGLAAQDDGDFEIIIADDGSLPDHVQAMQRAVNELGLAAFAEKRPPRFAPRSKKA